MNRMPRWSSLVRDLLGAKPQERLQVKVVTVSIDPVVRVGDFIDAHVPLRLGLTRCNIDIHKSLRHGNS